MGCSRLCSYRRCPCGGGRRGLRRFLKRRSRPRFRGRAEYPQACAHKVALAGFKVSQRRDGNTQQLARSPLDQSSNALAARDCSGKSVISSDIRYFHLSLTKVHINYLTSDKLTRREPHARNEFPPRLSRRRSGGGSSLVLAPPLVPRRFRPTRSSRRSRTTRRRKADSRRLPR